MIVNVPKKYIPSEDSMVIIRREEDEVRIEKENGESIGYISHKLFKLENGESLFERRNHFHANLKKDGTLNVIRYTPLHGHSGYSMLDGASKTKDMAAVAEHAMALTDHGNMFGALDFYTEMRKAGKKPILGFEAYSETIDGEKDGNHLLLLAENNVGYHNLVKLVSESNTNKFGKFNYVTYEMMERYSEGVIATSACLGGELSRNIMMDRDDKALQVATRLQEIFGKENFFVEIQRHGLPEERIVNPILIDIARKIDAGLVATSDSHYTHEEDREAQEVLMCLSTGDTMDNPDRFKLTGTGYHIHSSQEMAEKFADIPEVLDNTLNISDRVDIRLETDEIHMPHIEVPEKYETEDDYFRGLVWEGFAKRFEGTEMFEDENYKERLEFEMGVITSMGFSGYFIIMWDVIRFAGEQDILVGPGRGSACGSLVAYVLEITDVDPIPYGLLFERFLNPDRYSMPDIDTDFPNTRREEIIEYTRQKYGEASVARIVTYSTLSAKRVTRDVTKVLSLPFSYGSKIAEAIPDRPGMTLNQAFEESAEFKRIYEEEEDAQKIIDISLQLEGLPRNTSLHACGVVISNKPIDSYIPTFYAKNPETGTLQLTTQFDKDQVEEMGLLKMDFLGLKTLGVIEESIHLVNERRKNTKEEPITMRTIPVDDTETYKNIQTGNTSGVFQLEGPGMTKTISSVLDGVQTAKTKTSEESLLRLIATLSLYRPGPMDEIPNYIKNMKNPDKVHYETPEMKNVLSETHGVIVYQEQVMQLVRDLAGFSRGQSDIVRKGMAKKVPGLMDEWGEAFINGSEEKNIKGCVPNGIPESVAKDIWDKMVKFSDYAFNKSHAAGYSFVSARTGWLATHYPSEYYAAMMNVFVTEKEKAQQYLATAKSLKIPILQPSINHSQERFSVDGNSIRFGLNGISHVGKTAKTIINERNNNGDFKSMQDFAVRMVTNHKLTTRTFENLILAGALDEFEGTRLDKIKASDAFLELGKFIRDARDIKQPTLFDLGATIEQPIFNPPMKGVEEMDKETLLAKEREIAGFYITGHPITDYQIALKNDEKRRNYVFLSELNGEIEEKIEKEEKTSFNIRTKLAIAGVITDVETYYTKAKGDPLKVFNFEDETGSIKCIAFSSILQEKRGLFNENDLLYLEGNASVEDGEVTFIVNAAEDLHAFDKSMAPKHFKVIGHRNTEEARRQYKKLIEWATAIPAWERRLQPIPVIFEREEETEEGQKEKVQYDMGIKVPYRNENIEEIRKIVGVSSLKSIYA